MLKIDFTQPLKTPKGEPIVNNAKPYTAADAVADALVSGADPNDKGAVKVRRWNLACRIQQAGGPVEITTDDAADIRRLADLHFGTLVYAQLDALLAAAER